MAELIEYGCRWTDWDHRSDEHKTRVRVEVGGYGDQGWMTAEHIAKQTRQWQPHHGLPADAVVVSRPIGEWTVVAPKVSE